jgi:hypothetical protein
MLSLVAACALLAVTPAVPLPEEIESTVIQKRAATAGQAAILARLRQIQTAYANDKEPNEFKGKVCEAADLLLNSHQPPLVQQFAAPDLGKQEQCNAFKNQLAQIQMNIGLIQFKLDSMTEELDNVKNDRPKQPKTWQAYFDYVSAHTNARIAHIYEYNFQLGQMRKGFPPLDATRHEGWKLVPGGVIRDRDAAKYARNAKVHLERLMQQQAGTAWEKAGKAELAVVEAGLQWEAYSQK